MKWLPGLLLIGAFTLAIAHHQGLSDKLIASVRANYGAEAEARLLKWQDIIHRNLDSDELDKLNSVNDFFNRARFVDDIRLWHKKDYWATPVEFLARNAGDCEDFSIAKYFTLKEMGVDTAKLRITYVKALRLNQAHMVLAYYPTPSSTPLILDNLIGRIRPANERTDLQPVYSFNADDLWLSRTRNEQVKVGSSGQLGMWRELNRRMQSELPPSEPEAKKKAQIERPPSVKPDTPTSRVASHKIEEKINPKASSSPARQVHYPGISRSETGLSVQLDCQLLKGISRFLPSENPRVYRCQPEPLIPSLLRQ